MLEKVMPKRWKFVPKLSPMGNRHREQFAKHCLQKTMPKFDTKEGHTRRGAGEVGGPFQCVLNTDRQYLPTVTKKRQAKTGGWPQPFARQSRKRGGGC